MTPFIETAQAEKSLSHQVADAKTTETLLGDATRSTSPIQGSLEKTVPASTATTLPMLELQDKLASATVRTVKAEPDSGFTEWTKNALLKNADEHKPVHNADGSTTYFLTQAGVTDRPIDSASDRAAKYYRRDIDLTVPAGVNNFENSTIGFHDREQITAKQYDTILTHDQANGKALTGSQDVTIYTHGVFFTPGDTTQKSDTQALLLELTSGHPTVNVDWNSESDTHTNKIGELRHYLKDAASAKEAGPKLEPLVDRTIDLVGAQNTTMIGFSHGGLFDARYLRHRTDRSLPKVNTVVLDHPDVPITTSQLVIPTWHGPKALLSEAANQSFVVGGTNDQKLSQSKFIPGHLGLRLGTDSLIARTFTKWEGAVPITESPRADRSSDQHFVNFAAIAHLQNDKTPDPNKSQGVFSHATREARSLR